MIGKKIIQTEQLQLSQVKELLKQRAEQLELTYEQDVTSKYSKKFAKLSESKSQKLYSELVLIEGMDETSAIKLVDIMPSEKEIIRAVFPRNSKITDETIKKISELLDNYRK